MLWIVLNKKATIYVTFLKSDHFLYLTNGLVKSDIFNFRIADINWVSCTRED